MRGTRSRLFELIEAPRVRLQVLLILRVDSLELALGRTRVKQRRYEELSESFVCVLKRGFFIITDIINTFLHQGNLF